jgi:hypothetical protein
VVSEAAPAHLRVRRLAQVSADGTLGPVDQCCDQFDGSVAIGAVVYGSGDLSSTVNGPGHALGFVEVVLSHRLDDQVVLERHRLCQSVLEDAGVSAE